MFFIQLVLTSIFLFSYAQNNTDRWENISFPIPMTMSITSCKLLSMNEAKQTVNLLVGWDATWVDYRLQWDPKQFDGIEVIGVNTALLWLPDAMPVDLTSMSILGSTLLTNTILWNNGTCFHSISATVGQLCRLNIAYFPFDVQQCDVKLTSSNYNGAELSMIGTVSPTADPSTFGNGAWSIDKFEVKNTMIKNDFNGFNYPEVIYSVRMKRSSTYYVILIIIPSVIITSLTILGMFWSEITEQSYAEKVTLGFSSFLAQTVILQITTQAIPATSNLPGLSIYILINLVILFFSVLTILITASKINCEKTKKRQEAWLLSPNPFHRFYGLLWAKTHFLYCWIFIFLDLANFLVLILRRQ